MPLKASKFKATLRRYRRPTGGGNTPPRSDQPKDSSAAHAKVEVAIANVFKLILVRILIIYLPLAPPFKAMFLREEAALDLDQQSAFREAHRARDTHAS